MKTIAASVLFLLLASTQLFSQHGSNAYRNLADSLYRHHHYQYAAGYYEKALKKSKDAGYLMLQIAKCFDRVNDPATAERWFDKASRNRARFTDEDVYLYAEALVVQKKMAKADSLLTRMLDTNPNAHLARRALNDIRNFEKFYADSARTRTTKLSFNSDVAEFSPAFYKDGIVFSAAKQEGTLKKKYHWDNSHFLNLWYTSKSGDTFSEAKLFEKDLNTRHHDGPAAFYNNYQKMILNRNQKVKVEGREDVYELRPGLFDATYDAARNGWVVTPLPFNETLYAYSHPYISEDGSTLYFSSDKPGGYGGMDLYRVERVNGTWGTPFNLGPSINTEEDEAFPFVTKNTLYFASSGQGGLGGLDIFYSQISRNGYTPPVNMGFPINTSADDFSLITDSLQQKGYYASARSGNDDIYSFERLEAKINLFAHIFEGETKAPLSSAMIQVMTNSGKDITVTADQSGNFDFSIPKDEAFIVIGTKDDFIGMVSDLADSSKHIDIPAYRDTTGRGVVLLVKDEKGQPKEAAVITIVDVTTGETLSYPGNQAIIGFHGKNGHEYRITASDDLGNTGEQIITVNNNEKGLIKSTLVIPSATKMDLAVRVFRADDNAPLAGANVRVMTFGEDDLELSANDQGVAEFALNKGTAYVVVGSKDGYTGMHSGMAETGMDKANIIHPVPALGDQPNAVIAMGLITDRGGKPVGGYVAEVTEKSTGEKITLQANKGVLIFIGERGKTYNIKISHDDFETALQELLIPEKSGQTEKFAIILEEKSEIQRGQDQEKPLIAQLSKPSTLVFLDTEAGDTRAFITTPESLKEVTEKNGELFVKDGNGNRSIGKGTMRDLRENPSSLKGNGVNVTASQSLRNIYFDFDKATLDAEDHERLQQVKQVLQGFGNYTLTIGGHADDRGRENYNMKLSKRRTNAVSNYLIAQGVPKSSIRERAYGEEFPAVPCPDRNCSEQDHKLNRRAEFVLSVGKSHQEVISDGDPALATSAPATEDFNAMMKSYGDVEFDGVTFRINIGAYRKNSTLEFNELKDLGTVESTRKNGTTYYTLAGFGTLNKAEAVRKTVVERGIKGASISIYRKGDKIKLSDLRSSIQ